jgi:hypothetical protein
MLAKPWHVRQAQNKSEHVSMSNSYSNDTCGKRAVLTPPSSPVGRGIHCSDAMACDDKTMMSYSSAQLVCSTRCVDAAETTLCQ